MSTSPFLTGDWLVDGLHYHVEQHGPTDPAAPTLVLLHGFTGNGAGWGAHLEHFAAAGLRVIAPDLPGHGATDAPADPAAYDMAHTTTGLLHLLQCLEVDPRQTFLLGYSLGGRIALGTALAADQAMLEGLGPASWQGLILESASPGIADPAERAARVVADTELAERIERDGIPAFVEYWEQLPLFASQHSLPAAVQAEQRAMRLRNRLTGLANSLRGIGTGAQPALHSKLPTLSLPVLLIAGEHDAKFMAIAQTMAQSLPHPHLAIVPGAGHTVHLEAPETFDTLVLGFIKDTESRRTRKEAEDAEFFGHEMTRDERDAANTMIRASRAISPISRHLASNPP